MLNTKYLDKILSSEGVDYLYHFGISSKDPIIKKLKDIKAIVLSGSPIRTKYMAEFWARENKTELINFPKDERFSTFYTAKVLFSSHGMGMPSMSIALQELIKLLYLAKDGFINNIKNTFWCRVGTSGGLVSAGSIVITEQALCSDLKPYTQNILGKPFSFNPNFPKKTIEDILSANYGVKFNILRGKTIGANSFYIEQNRTDGAISFCTEQEKMSWLRSLYEKGFKNIEMETPMMAGILNHAGFTNFATICAVLINRLNGDQVITSSEKLLEYQRNAQEVLWNYLRSIV